jgi:hypothetical protein
VTIAVDYGMGDQYVTRVLDQVGQFRRYPKAIRTDHQWLTKVLEISRASNRRFESDALASVALCAPKGQRLPRLLVRMPNGHHSS